ncbi:hypothetical protein ALNOE001_16850 [Candidatus Methanobinarius endosymbioticus]|uniref:Uncharacterized protein n=1 Tax=Candidatus Methanobinarius endosymbioticus TaxID=2006182 RepID=A0A366M8S3_9EURY|nr:hypothetical protein ALNOE001_16850 [Candidatus Methanobinarius endosymbioticus]
MIFEIFKDSFEYSLQYKTSILKLGVLLIFSLLIIPTFLGGGYSYRTISITINSFINSNDHSPSYKNLGEMLIQGVKVVLVCFIYLLSLLLIFILTNGYLFDVAFLELIFNLI